METIELTVKMPRYYILDVPNADFLPAEKKLFKADLKKIEGFDAVLTYLFGRGIDHSKDTGALKDEDYPTKAKKAEAGYSLLVKRFDEVFYKGLVPKGGGGASLSEEAVELRKVVLKTFNKLGHALALKVTDIRTLSGSKPFATALVKAGAKAAKAKLSDEVLQEKTEAWCKVWEAKVTEVIKLRNTEVEIEGDLTTFQTDEPEVIEAS